MKVLDLARLSGFRDWKIQTVVRLNSTSLDVAVALTARLGKCDSFVYLLARHQPRPQFNDKLARSGYLQTSSDASFPAISVEKQAEMLAAGPLCARIEKSAVGYETYRVLEIVEPSRVQLAIGEQYDRINAELAKHTRKCH